MMGGNRRHRGHAVAAVLLSAVFPGLGQLYNRERGKAIVMIVLAVVCLLAVVYALGSVAAAVMTAAPAMDAADPDVLTRQLLAAAEDPALLASMRWRFLPSVLALCGVFFWSVVDAYVGGRRRGGNATHPDAETPRG